MGVDIADINNDGWQDIVTCDMRFDHICAVHSRWVCAK
jgi:hypothetical protein